MRREIVKDGGEATLCEARLIEGLRTRRSRRRSTRPATRTTPRSPRRRASSARSCPRGVIRRRSALAGRSGGVSLAAPAHRGQPRSTSLALPARSHRGPGRRARISSAARGGGAKAPLREQATQDFRGRVWVTRKGVHIDRIASAWLIRRFIDPGGPFQVRAGQGLQARARRGALRHVRSGVHARRRPSAPSRCCSRTSVSTIARSCRSPRSCTTSTSRTRSSSRPETRRHRPPHRRHRDGEQG